MRLANYDGLVLHKAPTPRARRLRAARINLVDARLQLAFGDVPGAIHSLQLAEQWRMSAKVVR